MSPSSVVKHAPRKPRCRGLSYKVQICNDFIYSIQNKLVHWEWNCEKVKPILTRRVSGQADSGIKMSEMLVVTSPCDVSHDFKNSRELRPSAFLCIWSQINADIRHSPQRIKTLPWLVGIRLPCGISYVRNDITPFKEVCPLPKYACSNHECTCVRLDVVGPWRGSD